VSRKIIYTVNSEDVDWQGAYKLVDKFHPAAHRLKPYAKRLHARNSFQVLGNDLMTPSSFVGHQNFNLTIVVLFVTLVVAPAKLCESHMRIKFQ
jgi:hypothetical protein